MFVTVNGACSNRHSKLKLVTYKMWIISLTQTRGPREGPPINFSKQEATISWTFLQYFC